MQAFGVKADVDAGSHRRRVPSPEVKASRAEVGRRAANFMDILDLPAKRHFHTPGTTAKAASVLVPQRRIRRAPDVPPRGASPSYDTSPHPTDGTLPCRRRFFDEQLRAQQYAELLDRPNRGPTWSSTELEGFFGHMGGALHLPPGAPLPLEVRRVMSALIPAGTDPKYGGEVARRLKATLQAAAEQRCRAGRSPRLPVSKLEVDPRPTRRPGLAVGARIAAVGDQGMPEMARVAHEAMAAAERPCIMDTTAEEKAETAGSPPPPQQCRALDEAGEDISPRRSQTLLTSRPQWKVTHQGPVEEASQ